MKSVTLYRSLLCVCLGLASVASQAADGPDWTPSGSLSFTNDYVFRGVSQTSGSPAASAGLDLALGSGFHAGLWGSSIGFGNGLELDTTVGFGQTLGPVAYDVSVVHYGYPGPGTSGLDFNELQGSLSWQGATIGAAWSDDFTGHTGTALYTHAGYGVTLQGVDLSVSVGQSRFHDARMDRFDGYVDYRVAVAKAFAGLDFELAVAGSNLDDSECGAFVGDPDSCSSRIIFSVSKSL